MLWVRQLLRPNSRSLAVAQQRVLVPRATARPVGLFLLPAGIIVRLVPSVPYFEASVMFSRAQVRRALQQVPGKQRFGIYRFLPFFFVLGGIMEWIMIKVRVGQETFCKWGCRSPRFSCGYAITGR
ncbi:small integral membrane protein 4 [Sigmodon hispidus]